jgi:AraC family transcriptional regulator
MPNAILAAWQKIFSEILPASGLAHAGTPELEVYYPGDTGTADYRSEVWIPVIKQ